MSKYFIENCNNLKNIYGYNFFNNFIQKNISEGMRIYRNNEYDVQIDTESTIQIGFKSSPASNYDITCKFNIDNDGLFISCDCDLQNYCEHIFASYLYIVYKYRTFDSINCLYPINHYNSSQVREFSSYYIAINGYALYLENDYSSQKFIDFLKFSSTRNFESMGDVRYELIVNAFFSINISLNDTDFIQLIDLLLKEFAYINNNKFLKALFLFLHRFLNKNNAIILKSKIDLFLEQTNNLSYNNKALFIFASARIEYEFIDEEKG